MSTALARIDNTERVELLDTRSETGLATIEGGQQLSMWAATISAGFMKDGKPQVARDKKIQLHKDMADCSGIEAALDATGYSSLTITMLYDNVNECLKQLFCNYGSTKIFGDSDKLTCMKIADGKVARTEILKGDPRFKATLETCKVSTFVPFYLAEWDSDGADAQPRITFPDGLIPYRLRFTSKHSVNSFVQCLLSAKKITGGKLAGIPLTLSLVNKKVMTPTLERREVPVWSLVLKHPSGLPMTTNQVRSILQAGIEDAAQLALEAPRYDHEAVFEAEAILDATAEDVEEAAEQIQSGDSPEGRRLQFFAIVRDCPLGKDERQRAVTLMAETIGLSPGLYCRDGKASLSKFVQNVTPEQWDDAVEALCLETINYKAPHSVQQEPETVIEERDIHGDGLGL